MDINWPYPQLLIGGTYQTIALRQPDVNGGQFIIMNVPEDSFVPEIVAEVRDDDYGSDYTPWEMADFGAYTMLTNGQAVVFYSTASGTFQVSNTLTTVPLARSICSFNNAQLVGGGVTSSWYDCDETYLFWSQIGNINCTPDRKNTAGYRRPRRGGTIYKVLQLEGMVLGYTSKEIVALVPVIEPAPTFRMEQVLPLGLCGRGAVGGNEHVHVCVDKAGVLWRIRPKQVERLGYAEYMTQLTAANIRISMNEVDSTDNTVGEFYITDGTKGFLLTPQGLTEIYQFPTGVGVVNGVLLAIMKEDDDVSAKVVSDTIDFGFRPSKTIGVMELGVTAGIGDTVEGSYYFKNDIRASDFSQTAWSVANANGVVSQKISGTDFRFAVRSDNFEDFYIDSIKVRWKMTDMRSIRGVYSPPPRGQYAGPSNP